MKKILGALTIPYFNFNLNTKTMNTKKTIERFKQNVKEFEHLLKGLECDGASRIIQFKMKPIKLYAKKTFIQYGDEVIPHYYCEYYDSPKDIIIFDFKSRMWLGNKALQGIFTLREAFENGVTDGGEEVYFDEEHTKILILSQKINQQYKH